jgi:hypothetical protein
VTAQEKGTSAVLFPAVTEYVMGCRENNTFTAQAFITHLLKL